MFLKMRTWISRCSVVSFLFLLAANLSGCATSPTSKDTKRIHALERKLKKQTARLEDLRERNLVLEKRGVHQSPAAATTPFEDVSTDLASEAEPGISLAVPSVAPTQVLTASRHVASATPVAPKQPSSISVSPEKTGEHYLYSKILETYRARNAREMETTLGLLLKSYPESVFADNALYLSGLMSFENGDLNGSKLKFDRLLKDFPRSNKAVAALFAKASIERKLGRSNEAKRAFIQVRDLFPGSPEAARVAVELKLTESASSNKQEM